MRKKVREVTMDVKGKVVNIQESISHLADPRPPEAVLFCETLLVNSLELLKMVLHQGTKR